MFRAHPSQALGDACLLPTYWERMDWEARNKLVTDAIVAATGLRSVSGQSFLKKKWGIFSVPLISVQVHGVESRKINLGLQPHEIK